MRKVGIHHWSWSYVLATAIVQKEHRGVSDPEQAWILVELIRYLEHERSGAPDLDDMGPNRTGSRCARPWPQEHCAPTTRLHPLLTSLVQTGELTGTIRIRHAVAPVNIVADLRANRITCYVDVGAPQEGRQTTPVNWIVRQLKDARPDVRVESFAARARGAGSAELLADVRKDPKLLVPDPNKDIRSFRIALSVPAGSKRGRGRGAFIDSVFDMLDIFYGEVVQHIKPWAATPPKLREADCGEEVAAELVSTDLSSHDGPITGD